MDLSSPGPKGPGVKLVLHECLVQWHQEAQRGEVDTGRTTCRYFSWGEGPALVFSPGLSLGALSFVMPMARLQKDFRCIGYDLPNGVDDGARLSTYRHRDLCDDLFALLDHLKIDRAYLLGYSFGSTVSLGALARQPGRFARGLLVGGFARRLLSPAEVFLARWARYWSGTLGDFPWLEPLVRRNHYEPFKGRPMEDWQFFVEQNAQPAWRTFAHRALLMTRTDLQPLLPAIKQPVLLVHGARDPLVSKACQDELRHGLACATRAEMEDCGHQPQLTHPEILAELVRQFLTPSAVCPA